MIHGISSYTERNIQENTNVLFSDESISLKRKKILNAISILFLAKNVDNPSYLQALLEIANTPRSPLSPLAIQQIAETEKQDIEGIDYMLINIIYDDAYSLEQKIQSIKTLSKYNIKTSFNILIKEVWNKDSRIRKQCIAELQHQPQHPKVLQALEASCLLDLEEENRLLAIHVLSTFPSKKVESILYTLLHDKQENTSLRHYALFYLIKRHIQKNAIQDIISLFYSIKDKEAHMYIVDMVCMYCAHNQSALESIALLCHTHKDISFQYHIIQSLGLLHTRESLSALGEILIYEYFTPDLFMFLVQEIDMFQQQESEKILIKYAQTTKDVQHKKYIEFVTGIPDIFLYNHDIHIEMRMLEITKQINSIHENIKKSSL